MADIAQIGFSVDTSQLERGGQALDQFGQKAKEAVEPTGAVEAAARRAGISVEEMRQRISHANDNLDKYTKSIAPAATATERHVAAVVKDSAAHTMLSGVWNSFTAVVARGVNGLMSHVTALENVGAATHKAAGHTTSLRMEFRAAAEAAGLMGGPLGEIIQKTGFLAVGSQHLGVGLLALFVTLGLVSKGLEKMIELLKEAAAESDTLSRIKFGSQIGQGLITVGQYSGNTAQDLLAAMVKFNAQVALARSGVGSLAELFAANNLTIKDTEDAWFKLADLIKAATGDFDKQQQFLTQAGLPATREMVKFLEQGAAAIRSQANATKKLTEEEEHAAREFEDRWNKLTTDLTNFFKKAGVALFDELSKAPDAGTIGDLMLRGLKGERIEFKINLPEPAPGSFWEKVVKALDLGVLGPGMRAAPVEPVIRGEDLSGDLPERPATRVTVTPVDPERVKAALQAEQQQIAILGETASVTQKVRLAELALQEQMISSKLATQAQIAAWGEETDRRRQNTGAITGQIGAVMSLAREQQTGVYAVKAQTDAARIQAATIGMSAGAAAEYTAVQTKLAEAIRNRAPLDKESEKQLRAQAAVLREVTQAAAEKAAQDKADFDLQTVGLSGISKQIADVQQRLHGNDWQKFMNDGLASTMRLTDALKTAKDTGEQFVTNLVDGLMSGKSAAESLGSALQSLSKAMANSAIKDLLSGDPMQMVKGAVEAAVAIGAKLFGDKLMGDAAAEKKLKDAQKAWYDLTDQVAKFSATLAGGSGGGLTGQLADINQQFMQLGKAAVEAQDMVGAVKLVQQVIAATARIVGDFVSQFEPTIAAMNAGAGPDGALANGIKNMQGVIVQVKDFVADTVTAFSAANVGQIERAKAASRALLLAQLSGTDAISDTATKIDELNGKALALQSALVDLGMSADQAAAAIAKARSEGLARIAKDFTDSITKGINEALGKSYINDLNDLIKDTSQKRADALALGADPALIDRYFMVSAQKIVDSAGLVGDSFNDLLAIFPNLTGVIHESTDAIKAQIEQQRQFYLQLQKDIADFIAGLQFGDLSTLSPAAKFAAAQTSFATTAQAALGGDQTAQGNFTKVAQAYLEQARSFLGPSVAYGSIYNQVTGVAAQLQALAAAGAGGTAMSAISDAGTPMLSAPDTVPVVGAAPGGGGGSPADIVTEIRKLGEAFNAMRSDYMTLMRALLAAADNGNALAQEIVDEIEGLRTDTRAAAHEADIRQVVAVAR